MKISKILTNFQTLKNKKMNCTPELKKFTQERFSKATYINNTIKTSRYIVMLTFVLFNSAFSDFRLQKNQTIVSKFLTKLWNQPLSLSSLRRL